MGSVQRLRCECNSPHDPKRLTSPPQWEVSMTSSAAEPSDEVDLRFVHLRCSENLGRRVGCACVTHMALARPVAPRPGPAPGTGQNRCLWLAVRRPMRIFETARSLRSGSGHARLGLSVQIEPLRDAPRSVAALPIATPEHDVSIPGLLKKAQGWASRPPGYSPFNGAAVTAGLPAPESSAPFRRGSRRLRTLPTMPRRAPFPEPAAASPIAVQTNRPSESPRL